MALMGKNRDCANILAVMTCQQGRSRDTTPVPDELPTPPTDEEKDVLIFPSRSL